MSKRLGHVQYRPDNLIRSAAESPPDYFYDYIQTSQGIIFHPEILDVFWLGNFPTNTPASYKTTAVRHTADGVMVWVL